MIIEQRIGVGGEGDCTNFKEIMKTCLKCGAMEYFRFLFIKIRTTYRNTLLCKPIAIHIHEEYYFLLLFLLLLYPYKDFSRQRRKSSSLLAFNSLDARFYVSNKVFL